MAKLSRDKQLVRAAKGRASIIGFLTRHKDAGPVTQNSITEGGGADDYTPQELGAMLYRMAAEGLILKHKIAPNPSGYTIGYTALDATTVSSFGESAKRPRKADLVTKATGAIDVRVNEKAGTITIRYAGLTISFGKEGA